MRVGSGAVDKCSALGLGGGRVLFMAANNSFNAVRADLLDLRTNLRDLRAEMLSKFDLTAAGQQQIAGMIQTLIDREER